ncbi:MAG: hypothetical protein KDA86_19680 [Planctomycetaceae bacterium]|nr:hypothetical protein [Planctomycetaceae bacterium]
MRIVMLVLLVSSTAHASALEEVNFWRTKNGLPALKEDKELTAAAQHKAEYRAARLLKDGHQGPTCPAGCREGTGEAGPEWGWLTCVMEETGTHAGAGVAIGADGELYMVLILRGTQGHAPLGRQVRPLSTAHLTPDAPRIARAR